MLNSQYNTFLTSAKEKLLLFMFPSEMLSQRPRIIRAFSDSSSKYHMFSFRFFAFILFLCSGISFCYESNTLSFNSSIRDVRNETLVSPTGKFQLGFFSPDGSSNGRRYVGIWYYRLMPKTVVWVANRNDALFDSTGLFGISGDGILGLTDGSGRYIWKKSAEHADSSKMAVQLMDSGNLVLLEENQDNSSKNVLWQSFEHPTDTFLPGMTINGSLNLTSWKGRNDPSGEGGYSFLKDLEENKYIIRKQVLNLKSGLSGDSSVDVKITPQLSSLLLNSSERSDRSICPAFSSLPHSNCTNMTSLNWSNNDTRLVMNFDGKLQFFRLERAKTWFLIWSGPDRCLNPSACGNFGSCYNENRRFCKCLPGFEPTSLDEWKTENYAKGCTRKSPVCSKNSNIDYFLKISGLNLTKSSSMSLFSDKRDCKKWCLDNCDCQAYSYAEAETYQRGGPNITANITCSIWRKSIENVQEAPTYEGPDIYLRVMRSDIERTKRTCNVCGTNVIPYPLSTNTSCGDPMYSNFSCNDTLQVYFHTRGGTYRVTGINAESESFFIDTENAERCTTRDMAEKILQLDKSSPFYVRSGCNANQSASVPDFESEWSEIEIGWRQPMEPLCNSYKDCDDLPDSSCSEAKGGEKRCLCHTSFQWDPSRANCTSAHSGEKHMNLYLIILGIVTATLIILCFAFLYHKRKRIMVNRQDPEKKRNQEMENLALRLHDSEKRIKDFINLDHFDFGEEDKKGIDAPCFDLETILAATDYFSDVNKLGQGGFGPVYKGTYPGGQEIAIKRLSSNSGQGLEEFKNEVVLIAKLQHRNLVRLLGYCVEGKEKMLVYEYMPNKSLDYFIFDRTRCLLLNWEMRFDIILGIARGMLYLHQDSRLRIIHRDLKTSNVLLDEEMNPKISDFGLARIFGGKQTEASTSRVVGTYGYMSPEYALDGFFSVKSDVFSFGVVMLEIISGKRNTGFYQTDQALSLLGYAWKLWKEERPLDLMEQALLRETCNASEFLRCVSVGLLCVQEDPGDRPTMSNVVSLLGNDGATLPNPKQPAFVVRRSLSGTTSSSKVEANLELTTTLEEGR